MAKLIIDNVLPEPGGTSTFYSKTHKRNVDLSAFVRNVKSRMDAGQKTLGTTPIVALNQLAIQKIARNGLEVWTSEDKNLKKLRDYCCFHVLPHAHATHRVEACIREASHVASTGRDEILRSAYGMQRSMIHSAITRETQREAASRTLHGNQNKSSGKMGERTNISLASKNKQDGAATEKEASVEDLLQQHVHVRGSFRARNILKNTKIRHDFVSSRPESEHKALLEHFTDPEKLFKKKRLVTKLGKFRNAKSREKENVREKKRGLDLTIKMVGRVTYTAIKKKMYIPYIQAELDFRKVEYSGKENVSALVLLLRKDEASGSDADLFFEPLTEILHIVEETD
jgi:hypothetical protein